MRGYIEWVYNNKCNEGDTNKQKGVSTIKVCEVAKILDMNPQTLRLALQQNKFPFGTAIRTSPNRYVYYINEKRLQKYLNGGDHNLQGSQNN